MRMPTVPVGLRLFLLSWLVYSVCPPFTSNDSYWTVPTALSLLEHGTTRVDQFVERSSPVSRHELECVSPNGPGVKYDLAGGCPDGHWYNFTPVGVSVLAAPLILVLKMVSGIIAAAFPNAAGAVAQPAISAFLAGDLFGGHVLVELWCASTFGAIAVWLFYRAVLLLASARTAVWMTLLFAFGTAEWSVASRTLMQHGLIVLLLTATLYLALRAHDDARWIGWAGIPLAMAFAVRPTSLSSGIAYAVFVAIHYRGMVWRFLGGFAVTLVPMFAYNLVVRHAWVQLYYSRVPPERMAVASGLAMYWFSPSRGLLIFTPVFLLSIVGIAIACKRRWCFPLAPYLIAALLVHSIAISLVWDGHSYGPRYFSDVTPIFVLFLIPVALYWPEARRLMVVLAAWGVFVHARGATSVAVHEWNAVPALDPSHRAWDWKDPQFLRGLFR